MHNEVTFETVNITKEILADIFSKHIQFIPLIGKSMAIAIQYITGLFVKTALGKRITEKTNQAFPFGYFLIAEKVK